MNVLVVLLIMAGLVYILAKRGYFSEDKKFVKNLERNTKRKAKFYRERIQRGWSDEDLWNMDYWLMEKLPEMLRHFSETSASYPPDCRTPEQWKRELKKMASNIEAFRVYEESQEAYDESIPIGRRQARQMRAANRTRKGLHQLADRVFDLWW